MPQCATCWQAVMMLTASPEGHNETYELRALSDLGGMGRQAIASCRHTFTAWFLGGFPHARLDAGLRDGPMVRP